MSILLSLLVGFFVYRNLRSIQGLQQRLYGDSITDPLTKCFNRRYFNQQYALLENQYRIENQQYSLAIIDIDHFKSINDTYGHDAGDNALRQLPQVINKNLRKSDQLFRVGGEEFVVLLAGSAIEEAHKVISRCHLAVSERPFTIDDDTELAVTVSAGIAESGQSLDIFKSADEALYQAKTQGRNRIINAS